jgi:hypothetical protein
MEPETPKENDYKLFELSQILRKYLRVFESVGL